MIIIRYILTRFFTAIFIVQMAILFLAFLMTLVEKMRVASNLLRPFSDAMRMTVLEMPATLSAVFPLVLMLAALVTFLGLSRSSELVVLRAAGISAIKMVMVPFLTAFLLGVLAILLFNPVVAVTTTKAATLLHGFQKSGQSILSFTKDGFWLRQGSEAGQTVIQADRASASGVILVGVRLHEFDHDGQLLSRIEATTAELIQGAWLLRGATQWRLDAHPEQALSPATGHAELRLPTDLTSDQILESFAAPETISFWRLPRFIDQLETAGFSSRRHRLYFQTELARPAFFAAMVLIGAGFSLRHVRFGQTGVMILFAIFAGFGLYFFKDVAESLGASGSIPLILAAWSPPAAAIMLAAGFLLHLEDG